MDKITIIKRQGDYMAYYNDDKRLWDRGSNPAEAIGALILTHGKEHGIVVDIQAKT